MKIAKGSNITKLCSKKNSKKSMKNGKKIIDKLQRY